MTGSVADIPRLGVWAASLALVAVTLLPLVRRPWWWVRVWDYPRLQIAVGLAVLAVAQAALLPGSLAVALLRTATGLCLAWQVIRILPYTRLHPKQVPPLRQPDPAETVTLLIANVLQRNRRADLLMRLIRQADPDIVLTLETNAWWESQLRPLLASRPHAVFHALENTYGMHLFSRLPLLGARVQERVTRGVPSIAARLRLRSGRLVDLHCLHPEPPQIGNDVAQRDAELLLVAQEVAATGRPTIVCGDMNDVAWSDTTRLFQRLSGLRDPRVGRGLYPTFHADYWFARWPLDHVFHDPRFRVARLSVLPWFGSDHFAILITLCHDPTAIADAEIAAAEAEAEDHEEAAQRIEEGRLAAAEGRPPVQD